MAQMTKAPTLPDQHEVEPTEPQAGLQSGDGDMRGVQQGADSPSSAMKRLRPWHSWLLHPAIKRLRHLAQMRGQLRALYGQSMTDCRMWDLKLAERWVARNWLAEPEDYFWLTMEEIERALMAETEMGPTLPALVNARRETYQMYARTEMPYTLRESDVARLVPGQGLAGTALASVLSGLPISPGQVQGRVVVLHRPEDAAHMQKGTILVAPSTDPAWFLIFPQAHGLIVEKGGLLSHGSIIAREFGLPAVADIPDATQRFHNGDLVLLDGSTGLVQILEPAAVETS
jgi:pyruvate,water dikinase